MSFLWVVIYTTGLSFAQLSADCINATPVCTTFYNTIDPFNLPPNNIQNEINPLNSCLSGGEVNGVWYTFTVQTSGILSFNIVPHNSTDDYDWALFDLTNAPCTEIASNTLLEVSCNYSNSYTNFGITGANGGPNNQDEPTLNVMAGQVFVLFISNFSGSTTGYNLDFANSTATIPDNSSPSLISAVPSDLCGATSIIIEFNENISCNSINPSDFTLVGPAGPVTINTVTSGSSQYSRTFNLNISPSMTLTGVYTLTLIGSIADVCGNTFNGPVVFNINNNSLSANVNVTNATCGNNDGEALAVTIGGNAPFSFLWSNGQTINPITNLERGNYSLTVTDAMGCVVITPFEILDPTSFTFTVSQLPDTCTEGNGVLTVNVVGSTSPYVYNFVGYQTGASNIYLDAIGDLEYVVKVTDNMNCWWADTVTVINILNNDLTAFYSVNNTELDFLYPFATFFNQSQNEATVQWIIDNQTMLGSSFQYQFPTYGDYPVSIIAMDANGCRDTFTMIITVRVILSLFIPNAITANNDGLNEVFKVKGIGMDTSTYQLWIFDHFGNEIFYSNDLLNGWDGKSQNSSVINAQDVYVYRLKVKDIYGDAYERIGRVTVIR